MKMRGIKVRIEGQNTKPSDSKRTRGGTWCGIPGGAHAVGWIGSRNRIRVFSHQRKTKTYARQSAAVRVSGTFSIFFCFPFFSHLKVLWPTQRGDNCRHVSHPILGIPVALRPYILKLQGRPISSKRIRDPPVCHERTRLPHTLPPSPFSRTQAGATTSFPLVSPCSVELAAPEPLPMSPPPPPDEPS